MRLDINLASQPYEDSQQFWLRWGGALGVVAILTLILLFLTVDGWYNARRDRAQIAKLQNEISATDQERSTAESILNEPQNRATRDESRFLNQLIQRKAFSWTRVLEELERVMPARVHVVSIQPDLSDDNQLLLKMIVAGDSRDRGIELARRMEASHHFAQTYVTGESFSPALGHGDNVQFEITAVYVPESPEIATGKTQPSRADAKAPASDTAGESRVQIAKRRKP